MLERFICHNCGETFDEPKIVYESRGEFWGTPAYEPMAYCPACGSDEFDEREDEEEKDGEE